MGMSGRRMVLDAEAVLRDVKRRRVDQLSAGRERLREASAMPRTRSTSKGTNLQSIPGIKKAGDGAPGAVS